MMKSLKSHIGFPLASVLVFVCTFLAVSQAGGAVSCGNDESPVSAIHTGSPEVSPYRPYVALSAGKFLVAGRNITGSFFAETVILLINYGRQGAIGVIVNKPSQVALSEILPQIKGVKQRKDFVYVGGPVGIDEVLLLIRSSVRPEESLQVFGDVFVSSSRSVLEGLIAGSRGADQFRAYAGYAGWSPGQLETEVSRGDWAVLPADAKTIFDKKSSDIWPELIGRASAQWVAAPPQRSLRDF